MEIIHTDVLVVGTGASGLFAALHINPDKNVLMITKDQAENSDSFLAQGGICVLHDDDDYDSFMEDTLTAGHYENRRESVDIMIRSSRGVIRQLVDLGVEFAQKDGQFLYTREGCHSRPRILYHEDVTGKEITSKLLAEARRRPNIVIREYVAMVDIIADADCCYGVLAADKDGQYVAIRAEYTILASGGVGGLYERSTNFPHLTGDAIAIALRHGIALENIDYVQIHPTSLYTTHGGRSFLISESVRGEGAKLYGKDGKRFASEVLPRDAMTAEIRKQMAKDDMPFVWLDMTVLGKDVIFDHFPNIYKKCLEEGYDVTKEWIPVVPAQHYFMGGIHVDANSKTTMDSLYAVGETSCNGVHGRNRLASNSLLESLVFGERAAADINSRLGDGKNAISADQFARLSDAAAEPWRKNGSNIMNQYKEDVLQEMERERKQHEA